MESYPSRCFAYYGPGDVRLETREIACGPTDMILRVEVCGRCGTDRRLFKKRHDRVRIPAILGDEMVGRVVEVGSAVRALTEGIGYLAGRRLDRARLDFQINQRATIQPRIARHAQGLMLMKDPIENVSFHIPGAYAQYMKVTDQVIRSGGILPIADSVSDEAAALTEPAACALESIFATPHPGGIHENGRYDFHSGLKPGGRTMIIGSGTLEDSPASFFQTETDGRKPMLYPWESS